jgi:hypothetical protein
MKADAVIDLIELLAEGGGEHLISEAAHVRLMNKVDSEGNQSGWVVGVTSCGASKQGIRGWLRDARVGGRAGGGGGECTFVLAFDSLLFMCTTRRDASQRAKYIGGRVRDAQGPRAAPARLFICMHHSLSARNYSLASHSPTSRRKTRRRFKQTHFAEYKYFTIRPLSASN